MEPLVSAAVVKLFCTVLLAAVGYENVRWMELSQEFVHSWALALTILNLDLKLPEFIDWSGRSESD